MIIADSLYYTKFKLHCRVSFCLLFTTSFMQYRIGGKCMFVLLRRKKKKETFQSFEIVPSQTMDRVYHNQSALTIF
jgi:hypothetical protein